MTIHYTDITAYGDSFRKAPPTEVLMAPDTWTGEDVDAFLEAWRRQPQSLEKRYRVCPGTAIALVELEEARRVLRSTIWWAETYRKFVERYRDPRTGYLVTEDRVPEQDRWKYIEACEQVGRWEHMAKYAAKRLAWLEDAVLQREDTR